MELPNAIKVTNVSKSFQNKSVLTGIDLAIKKGEIFGLLGPSGAGKTTLIKIITGQITINTGDIVVLGNKNINKDVFSQIGMVLDDSGLYDRLTCFDNLKLFADIYRISKTKLLSTLDKVGLGRERKTTVSKLSKGMRQRLILARAILHSPKILFLDEPTGSLDPATSAEIHKLILEQKESGVTIFLTTHNMEEASKLCDHIALIHEGNIIEYGVPAELCRKYNEKNQIHILLTNDTTIELHNNKEAAKEIYQYFEDQMVVSIHSTEPNLETVFMQLTGKGLVS